MLSSLQLPRSLLLPSSLIQYIITRLSPTGASCPNCTRRRKLEQLGDAGFSAAFHRSETGSSCRSAPRLQNSVLPLATSTSPCSMKQAATSPGLPHAQPPPNSTHSPLLLQFLFRVAIHDILCSVFALHTRPPVSFSFHHRKTGCDSPFLQRPCGSSDSTAVAGRWATSK